MLSHHLPAAWIAPHGCRLFSVSHRLATITYVRRCCSGSSFRSWRAGRRDYLTLARIIAMHAGPDCFWHADQASMIEVNSASKADDCLAGCRILALFFKT